MPIEGVDASYDRGSPAGLAAAGKQFFVGYVSPESGKNITESECAEFHAVGMAICLVWENTGREVLKGHVQGLADGRQARDQATALGFPAGRPIYHAIDFDASTEQLSGPIADYFRGVAAAEGSTGLVGVYGGLHQIGYLLDHHLVGYAWQTYAWSGGQWDDRAQAQQYHNGVQLAGGTVDLDRAMTDDYGQWEPDMPLTTDDVTKNWEQDGMIENPSWRGDAKINPFIKPISAFEVTMDEAHAASTKADQILAALAAAAKVEAATLAAIQALTAAVGTPVDTVTVVAAIEKVGATESSTVADLLAKLAAAQHAPALTAGGAAAQHAPAPTAGGGTPPPPPPAG